MRIIALILCALAMANLNWSTPANSKAAAAPAELQLPHVSIESVGQGDPVVLIPGLSTPREVWAGIVPELAKSHRVLLVQVNGFGGGDLGANLAPGLLDGVVADLHAYLAREKLPPATVIGHSMGGLVALKMAKSHPADLSKMMIVDSLPFAGDIFVPGATVAQVEPQAKAMRDQMIASFGKPGEAIAKRTAATMALTAAAQAQVAEWIARADPRVSGEALYEDLTTDLRPDMSSISTPITLVYPTSDRLPAGRADPFYRSEYAKAPNVTFVAIRDSGHFIMLDQPQAFAAAVEHFVG